MQVLQDKLGPASLEITVARPGHARQVAKLYRKVYGNEYPSPELFTEEGMAEFLTFERSHTFTLMVPFEGDVIAVASFEIRGRVALSRGFMVDPAWQGKIGARQVFQRILLQARRDLEGKVDYFLGELRTASAKLQGIIEEIGFRPLGTLPFKDIFAGKREVEIVYAYFYQEPRIACLRLTPRAAQVASAVLKQQVPAVRVFVPPLDESHDINCIVKYVDEPNGEGCLHISLPSGAYLEAIVCPAPRNSDRIAIHAENIIEYTTLLRRFLAELEDRSIEYTEVCVPADNPARQKVLEDLGFSPTGFLPRWYAPGENCLADHVFYTIHFTSEFPEAPAALTPQGEYLRPFITAAFVDAAELSSMPELKENLDSLAQNS